LLVVSKNYSQSWIIMLNLIFSQSEYGKSFHTIINSLIASIVIWYFLHYSDAFINPNKYSIGLGLNYANLYVISYILFLKNILKFLWDLRGHPFRVDHTILLLFDLWVDLNSTILKLPMLFFLHPSRGRKTLRCQRLYRLESFFLHFTYYDTFQWFPK